MGLDTLDSLAQQYAAGMTLSSTDPPHHPRSSLLKVFSIPELVNAITQYLNTSQLLKLGLVSKTLSYIFQPQLSLSLFSGAFHEPPFGTPGAPLLLPDAFRRLAPRVNTLTLDLLSFQEDKDQSIMLETLYEHSAVALHRLRITYWGEDLGVLEEILTRLPNLTDLAVIFKSSSDASAFPKLLIKVGRARQSAAVTVAGVIRSQHQGDGCGGLKTLAIELCIPKVKALEMTVLSELVQVWPDLTSLELAFISLKVNPPTFLPSTADITPPPPPPPPPLSIAGSVPPQTVTATAAAATVTASLPLPAILPSQPVDILEEPSFPRMKTLTLTECTLSSLTLRALDSLFPSLQRLELSSCPGEWYRSFAGVRTSQIGLHSNLDLEPDVPFLHLRRLNIWDKVQSAREKILGIVKHRPHLTCIATDIFPDSRDGLLELAAFCSGVEVNDLVAAPGPPSAFPYAATAFPSTMAADPTATASASVGVSDIAIVNVGAGPTVTTGASMPLVDMSKVKNQIKRLAIQTYASPPHDMETIERFYNAPAFRHLEYVYMQNRELSMKLFPFAKTLRELNIGGPDGRLQGNELTMLNSILHQLHVLEVFKLDRHIDRPALSKLFQGFGPEPESALPQDKSRVADTKSHGGQKDGSISCLRKLRLLCMKPDNGRLFLRDLETDVLDRLMFLEKLTVKSWLEEHLPMKEDIVWWQENVLPREAAVVEGGDGGEGERSLSSSSFVTRCKIVFKARSQKFISVIL